MGIYRRWLPIGALLHYSIVTDLAPFDGERRIGVDELDLFEVQLELVYRELICGEALGNLTNQASESVDFVRASLELVCSMLQESTFEPPGQGYSAPIIYSGQRGRPTFLITCIGSHYVSGDIMHQITLCVR